MVLTLLYILIGYSIIGIFTVGINKGMTKDTDPSVGFFWPLWITMVILGLIATLIFELGKKLGKYGSRWNGEL